MRVVKTSGPYQVCEDSDYNKCLCQEQNTGLVPHYLWGVLVKWAFGSSTVYVLAATAEDAISQARCSLSLESHKVSELVEASMQTEAQRIPFLIRGWGSTNF